MRSGDTVPRVDASAGRWPASCVGAALYRYAPPAAAASPAALLGPRDRRARGPGLRLVMAARVGAGLAAAGRGTHAPAGLCRAAGAALLALSRRQGVHCLGASPHRRSAATADPGDHLGGGAFSRG